MNDLTKRIADAHTKAAEACEELAAVHEEVAFLDVLMPGTSLGASGADYQIAVHMRDRAVWHRRGAKVFGNLLEAFDRLDEEG